jgi:hypothetical protein
MPLRLETDGAAIVRGFLSHRQFSRGGNTKKRTFDVYVDRGV